MPRRLDIGLDKKASQRESQNARYCRYKILSGGCFLGPGVLDLVVDIVAVVSDLLNLGGDVGDLYVTWA